MLYLNKSKNPSQNGNEVENEDSISDVDLDNIVGVGNSSELEVLSLPEDFAFWWRLHMLLEGYNYSTHVVAGNGTPWYTSV